MVAGPAMKMLTLPQPTPKNLPFAVIEVAVVSEEARHGVQAELFGNFGLLGDTGKRLTFVSFSPTVQAIDKQFLPRDGFRHVATSSVSSHPTWQRRDLQAMKQHVKEKVMLGKQRLEDTGVRVTQTAFGNTNVSPALLGRWRLLLVRGGSALVSKKGMLSSADAKASRKSGRFSSPVLRCWRTGLSSCSSAASARRSEVALRFFWVAARAMVVRATRVGHIPSGAKVHVQ